MFKLNAVYRITYCYMNMSKIFKEFHPFEYNSVLK